MENTNNVSILMEDYAEYISLLKAREVIVYLIESRKSVSVSDLLTILGGAKALNLKNKITREAEKEQESADDTVF